jgi:membrane-associated phospholipid phosphatase
MDLQYLLWLQSLRESNGFAFDGFFAGVTNLCSAALVFLMLCLIYWSVDKKTGQYLMLADLGANFVSAFLKIVFCVYRPWIRNPEIHPVEKAMPGATGYSFPSGHSSNAAAIYGGLGVTEWKKRRLLSVFLFSVMLLVAFSRNYCEVHTPQDVIAGLLIGFFFLWAAPRIIRFVKEGRPEEHRGIRAAVIIIVLNIALILYAELKSYPVDYDATGALIVDPEAMSLDALKTASSMIGAAAGWLLEHKFVHFTTDAVKIPARVLRFAAGVVLLLLIMVPGGTAIDGLLGKGSRVYGDVYAAHVLRGRNLAYDFYGCRKTVMREKSLTKEA